MNSQFTFQVNLSPGDVQYAAITIPELAKYHMSVPNRLLIVDCCKPQRTKLVNPGKRFPEPDFSERVKQICLLAEKFKNEKLFTEVYYLFPQDTIFKTLSKKYLNNIVHGTHGAGGTAQMSYWAAIELTKTRYIIHYDGDMFFYQDKGYEWWQEAVNCMEREPAAIFAIPRHAPPTPATGNLPTFFEGTEIVSKENYWLHNWFSTRLFLIDKLKLDSELPLVKGKIKWELLLRKLPFRAFPLDPEIILFRRLGMEKSFRRLILKTTKAWSIHPLEKSKKFIEMLPEISSCVRRNIIPEGQSGKEDIDLEVWDRHLHK